ncbi:hypothetical protein LCGC14_2838050 [marine sediment metagenome]|uniref:Uncharacterized protein n=1 Tax=marine sediment metagenome TaxID=412755 RepID=A0A0F8YYQ3_9ZZZZ
MKVVPFNAHTIAAELVAAGVAIRKVVLSDDFEMEDDSIEITPTISVQVGETYLIVNVDNSDDSFTSYPATSDSEDLVNRVKGLVS